MMAWLHLNLSWDVFSLLMVDWLQLITVLVKVCCREGWLVSLDIPKICDSLDYYLGFSCGDSSNFTSI